MVIEWLEWEAQQRGYHVRHHGNHKEKVIERRRLPVYGYVKETNTYTNSRNVIGMDMIVIRTTANQTMAQRYQRTQEKIQYIQDNGYPVK